MKISHCGDGSVPTRRDDGVEEAVLERREVVGLPVVAGARGEQRVERLLPGRVRLDADVLAEGVPNFRSGG